MLTKKERCHKLLLIFLKSVRRSFETVKNDGGDQVVVVFTNSRNKLFSGKPILQFVLAPFLFIFAVLNFFAALFALFLA